jgi:hypothetical protein
MRPWLPNGRQAQGVVQVAFPEAVELPRAKKPETDRLGVRLLEPLGVGLSQRRTPVWSVPMRPMFHVKRYVGRMTTRRLGSSPRLSVCTPSIAATAS